MNDDTHVMPAIVGSVNTGIDDLAKNGKDIARGYLWDSQVGGNHYSRYAIQPTEYIMKNRLTFVEGNIIKYVTRYKDKNGLEDLYKAKHYLDILIRSIEEEVNGR